MNYKLIKEYPGSPKLGTVVEINNDNVHCLMPTFNYALFPEYWEPIKEVLIKTHDGRPIHKDDHVWQIDKRGEVTLIYGMTEQIAKHIRDNKVIIFATEDTAKYYASQTNRIYSRRDIMNFINKHSTLETHYGTRILHATYEDFINHFIENEK
jgi:hypothetical protein